MSERLFHVAHPAELRRALTDPRGELAPPSLAREGFVHLSLARQLAGTLAAHFAGADEVALVEVELAPDDPDLAREPSRGGELFPHLYRPLARAELVRAWTLRRAGDALAPPALAEEPGGDAPRGLEPAAWLAGAPDAKRGPVDRAP